MTSGWVPYWDDSFDQVTDLAGAYGAGYRVLAGYVAGGSSTKWSSAARIQKWLAQGPDTGFFPLFEGTGEEPINDPTSGGANAKTARAGARARGVPDSVSISPAVDTNVNQSEWTHQLLTYFTYWTNADTVRPVPYVEADAGSYLVTKNVSAGTFTPAAYAWNVPPVLYTPDNAPAHVVCTQEHNGKKMFGGTADIGHIRTVAPCVWWKNGAGIMQPQDVWQGAAVDIINPAQPPATAANPAWQPKGTLEWLVNRIYAMGNDIGALKAELDAQGVKIDQILAQLQAGGGGGGTTPTSFTFTGTAQAS